MTALTAAQQALADAMLEAELEAQVAALCRDLGLMRYHTHRSERSEPGFPDDVIVGRRRVLYRELKRETGKPTAAQMSWLVALAGAGQDADVWRPSDLLSGRIVHELRSIVR